MSRIQQNSAQRENTAWTVDITKEERSKISNVSFHLRRLEKEGQVISKVNRRK